MTSAIYEEFSRWFPSYQITQLIICTAVFSLKKACPFEDSRLSLLIPWGKVDIFNSIFISKNRTIMKIEPPTPHWHRRTIFTFSWRSPTFWHIFPQFCLILEKKGKKNMVSPGFELTTRCQSSNCGVMKQNRRSNRQYFTIYPPNMKT